MGPAKYLLIRCDENEIPTEDGIKEAISQVKFNSADSIGYLKELCFCLFEDIIIQQSDTFLKLFLDENIFSILQSRIRNNEDKELKKYALLLLKMICTEKSVKLISGEEKLEETFESLLKLALSGEEEMRVEAVKNLIEMGRNNISSLFKCKFYISFPDFLSSPSEKEEEEEEKERILLLLTEMIKEKVIEKRMSDKIIEEILTVAKEIEEEKEGVSRFERRKIKNAASKLLDIAQEKGWIVKEGLKKRIDILENENLQLKNNNHSLDIRVQDLLRREREANERVEREINQKEEIRNRAEREKREKEASFRAERERREREEANRRAESERKERRNADTIATLKRENDSLRTQVIENSYKCYTSLSSVSVSYSNNSYMRSVNNRIIVYRDGQNETCVIGDVMRDGIYKLEFLVDHFRNGTYAFGLIDYYLGIPSSGYDITSDHKGVAARNIKHVHVGTNEFPREGTVVGLEVDLRSNQPERRTLKHFVNGRQQKIYFTHLPSSVQFAVSLKGVNTSLMFLLLEHLKYPTTGYLVGERGFNWNG